MSVGNIFNPLKYNVFFSIDLPSLFCPNGTIA